MADYFKRGKSSPGSLVSLSQHTVIIKGAFLRDGQFFVEMVARAGLLPARDVCACA